MKKYLTVLKLKCAKQVIRWSWFKAFFSDYQWYRKAYGGHWELWNIDVQVCSASWCDVKRCSRQPPVYREPGWRGTLLCRPKSNFLEI